MIGRVRLTIDMPFDFVLEDPDETGHSNSRINAAKHAEEHLTSRVRSLVAGYGSVVSILVEEVREDE